MKWMSLIAFLGLLALNCQNTEDTSGDTGDGKTPAADDLPQPVNETAEMSLNGVRHTLTNKLNCKSSAAGIGFTMPGGGNPTLFLHGADLSATGNITIKTGSNPLAWHMDIDPGPWGTQAAGCSATVVENSAIFELKVIACDVKNQFGAETGKVSFRVRCTKGT